MKSNTYKKRKKYCVHNKIVDFETDENITSNTKSLSIHNLNKYTKISKR